MSFVECSEKGISPQSSFTDPPSPQTMPSLGELCSSLIKKEVLESPFMIHPFIHSITVPIIYYDRFCFSQQIPR